MVANIYECQFCNFTGGAIEAVRHRGENQHLIRIKPTEKWLPCCSGPTHAPWCKDCLEPSPQTVTAQAETMARLAGERDEARGEARRLRVAINGLGWHSQNGVDVCWCHVKSGVDGYQHAEKCIAAREAIRKVEGK